jgi:hypothetical protein
MIKKRHAVDVLVFFLMLTAAVTADAGGKGQLTIHGKTYGEWSAKWWQWIRSIPDPDGQSHPLTNSGEVDCSIGQSGPVFFLAGTTGSTPVVRECTVPKGKELFFSPLNFMFHNEPADPPLTEAEKRELLDSVIDDHDNILDPFNGRACHLAVTVDGVSTVFSAVTVARTQSPAFRIAIGAHDVFGGTAGTVDEAAVSDGFWVTLRLPKGQHTLQVQGALCDLSTHEPLAGFQQDYTYHLLVK